MTSLSSGSRSTTVAKNFVWGALEILLEVLAALYTTIAVARYFGPAKVGYFNYIFWLTSMSATVGSLGLPLTTIKYMAEFLGANNRPMARAVFVHTLRIQAVMAVAISTVGLVLVWLFVPPEYRLVGTFLVLGVIPQMVTYIPSMGNTAFQDFRSNAYGGFVAIAINVIMVALTLSLNWGLTGIAIGVLASRSVELAVKARPLLYWLKREPAVPLPRELRRQLLSFSSRGTSLMLLGIVIWDRSDVVLLKLLQPDIRQLAFFSVSFSLVERLMILPQAFGRALSATQMAEYGRDKDRLLRMTSVAARYALLGSLPLLLGASCLSAPAVRLLYGSQYLPAIPVFALATLFAVPKAVLQPANSLLCAADDTRFLLKWSCFCAAVNVGLDILLIPQMAAVGAAIGNGVAQTLAAVGIWSRAVMHFNVELNYRSLVKLAAAAIAMAAAVILGTSTLSSDVAKVLVGIPLGAAAFLAALKVAAALDHKDRARILTVITRLPAPLHWPADRLIQFVAAREAKVDS